MNEKVITSKDNELVKYAAALSEKRERIRCGCFLMEGRRAVSEALAAGIGGLLPCREQRDSGGGFVRASVSKNFRYHDAAGNRRDLQNCKA